MTRPDTIPPASDESILFFVPMYRCAPQIPRVIAQFEALADLGLRHAMLCVDNRSPDDTLQAAQAALEASSVRAKWLVRNDDNYGLGGSHKVAFDFAREHGYDYVVVLHGDDQGSIADLLPLIRRGEHRAVDALLGARFMAGSRLDGYSTFRNFGNHVINLLFSAIAGLRFHDLGSGLNLFRRAPFDGGFHRKFGDDLTFNYYLSFGMAEQGLRLRFFPIHWREDDQISNVRLFSQARRTLQLAWRRLTAPAAFAREEHRQQPRDDYPYTLVRSWE